MPFEKGNQLGAKGKLFQGALQRAIAQDDGVRLREAAETLLTLASQGEAWAVKELADRLDGKVAQALDLNHAGQVQYTKIERVIVGDTPAQDT